MADGDCAAVYIHLVEVESELAGYSQRLHGEGFVEFVEINVVGFPARFLPDRFYRADRGHHDPFGFDAAGGLRHDAHDGLSAEFFGALRAGYYDRGSAVVYSGGVAG